MHISLFIHVCIHTGIVYSFQKWIMCLKLFLKCGTSLPSLPIAKMWHTTQYLSFLFSYHIVSSKLWLWLGSPYTWRVRQQGCLTKPILIYSLLSVIDWKLYWIKSALTCLFLKGPLAVPIYHSDSEQYVNKRFWLYWLLLRLRTVEQH